jgi:hypothetical protein
MSATLGFAAAVRAHGDGWRVMGACEHWHEGRERQGRAVFFAEGGCFDDRRDYHLMRDFLPGGIYAERPRAWGGLPA